MRLRPEIGALVCIALLLLVVLVFVAFGQRRLWVEHRNVMVHFVVLDSQTDLPIPEAVIQIGPDADTIQGESSHGEVSILTDRHGKASQVAENVMVSGSHSFLGNSVRMREPQWIISVAAKGYQPVEMSPLAMVVKQQQGERGNGEDSITVPLHVTKVP